MRLKSQPRLPKRRIRGWTYAWSSSYDHEDWEDIICHLAAGACCWCCCCTDCWLLLWNDDVVNEDDDWLLGRFYCSMACHTNNALKQNLTDARGWAAVKLIIILTKLFPARSSRCFILSAPAVIDGDVGGAWHHKSWRFYSHEVWHGAIYYNHWHGHIYYKPLIWAEQVLVCDW